MIIPKTNFALNYLFLSLPLYTIPSLENCKFPQITNNSIIHFNNPSPNNYLQMRKPTSIKNYKKLTHNKVYFKLSKYIQTLNT